MRDAVEREQRRKQHCNAVDRILANRVNAPRFSEAEFRTTCEEARSLGGKRRLSENWPQRWTSF